MGPMERASLIQITAATLLPGTGASLGGPQDPICFLDTQEFRAFALD
jgi:hypothetical protein